MLFQSFQRIMFVGDSITDADRTGAAGPYGNGYVNLLRNSFLARYPELNLTFINLGVGGDTVRNLDARWERDVISQFMDWLVVCIRINDVWRHFAYDHTQAVPVDEYLNTLRRLLQRARSARNAHLILMTPYMIEPGNSGNLMRRLMDVYGQSLAGLAKEFGAVLVDTQAAFDAVLKSTTPAFWSNDQIHVGPPGHMVIAQAFMRAVGFAL